MRQCKVVWAGIAVLAGGGVLAIFAVGAAAAPPPQLCGLPLLPGCPSPPPPQNPPQPPPSGSPAPTPPAHAGGQYDGHAGDRWLAQIGVGRGGTGLAGFDVAFRHGSCSNGNRYHSVFGAAFRRQPPINQRGHASFWVLASRASFETPRGKKIWGKERIDISLQFAGDRVEGTLHDRFWARQAHCSSGLVRFDAYRDGTARAPLRTARIDTAHYSGQLLRLNVFLPQDWITDLKIKWTWYCPAGDPVVSMKLPFLRIHGTRFGAAARGRLPGKHGIYYRYHWRLSGEFTSQGGERADGGQIYDYSVQASWTYIFSAYRSGRAVGTCSTSPSTVYTATGPEVIVPGPGHLS